MERTACYPQRCYKGTCFSAGTHTRPLEGKISYVFEYAKPAGQLFLLFVLALLMVSCGGGGGGGGGDPAPAAPSFSTPTGLPEVRVTVSNSPSPGFIYMGNFQANFSPSDTTYTPYIMTLDNSGAAHFFQRVSGIAGFDFKIQPNGRLSFYTVTSVAADFSTDGFLTATDSNHVTTGTFRVPGGRTDGHDSIMLPNGDVIMMEYYDTVMDLRAFGGNAAATVTDIRIVEIDASGSVVFQWNGLDHVQVADTTVDLTTAPPGKVDYAHANSIDLDLDGGLILSMRHLDQVLKIDRRSGDIIWRLGGRNSNFVFVNDPLNGPSYQHCVRVLTDGNLLMFDNGNLRTPPVSRAAEYRLDFGSVPFTATLVWQYTDSPPVFSSAMGSVQRLANGNTLIGWGLLSNPAVSEVTQDGTKVLEMALPDGTFSYRAFKFPQ